MASGDPLFVLRAPYGITPLTSGAGQVVIAGVSSPVEQYFAYAFDAGSTEYVDFRVTMPGHYSGGGLAFECEIHMASAITNSVRLEAAIRYLYASESLIASHSYSFQGVTITVPGTLNYKASGTILFSFSQSDSWPAAKEAIIRVRRKHDHAGDTASGDMYLAMIYARERSTGE